MTDSAFSLPYLCQISETVDGGDPSKMLRCDDDDTFVLTGGKSDIALFPLQLPAGDAGTNLDRLMACPPKSVSRNGWKCHSHSRLPSLAQIPRSLNPATSLESTFRITTPPHLQMQSRSRSPLIGLNSECSLWF